MSNFDRLSKTTSSIFRGLSWAAMHRLAEARRPVGHCRENQRQCDACRGAAHLSLALIIWQADDERRGVPRSMGAAAREYMQSRGSMMLASFRPRVLLLRGGGWLLLQRRTLQRVESVVRFAPASDGPVDTCDYVAAVVVPSGRKRLGLAL